MFHTGTLLIAEDEGIIARGMRMVLEDAGFTVSAVVATGPAAVEAAEQIKPDLALMDVRLADGTNGIEAAVEIRQRLGIQSIIISGNITDYEARAIGALGFLRKPILPHTMVETVSGAIGWLRKGLKPEAAGLFVIMPEEPGK